MLVLLFLLPKLVLLQHRAPQVHKVKQRVHEVKQVYRVRVQQRQLVND